MRNETGMRAHDDFGGAFSIGLMVLGLACGGTMNTGSAKRPVNNKPAADGTCPAGRSLCGTGVFAICVDLQDDPNHCGACDRACSPGIACQATVCQQTTCASGTMPFSGQPTRAATAPTLPNSWGSQILADINGDGRLDLVDWSYGVPDHDWSVFHVSLGLPAGGFAPPDAYRASADVIEVFTTDVNDDGFDDLYLVASPVNMNAVFSPYRVELWLGHGDGRLTRSDTVIGRGDALTFALGLADLSGDGWPDLVMMTPDGPNSGQPSGLDVYLSDSTGALHLSKSYVTGWGSIGSTLIWDWNGDGSPDIAEVQNSLQILYNRGDGTFEPPVDCAVGLFYGGEWISAPVVQDLNRDGWLDLVQGASGGRIAVLFGLGGCGFTPLTYYDVPGASGGYLHAADMNGDGILDIVSISVQMAPDPRDPSGFATVVQDHLLTVLLGKPDGTFQPQDEVISLGPGDISQVSIGEVSGDRRPDVVIAGPDGQTRTWENTCQ
jgi:hypothetical protein